MNDLIVPFIVNAVWQTTLIGAAAILTARFLAPRARHAVLSAALIACVAAPFGAYRPRATVWLAAGVAPRANTLGILAIAYLGGLVIALLLLATRVFRAWRILRTAAFRSDGFLVSSRIDVPVTIGSRIVLPLPLVESGDEGLIEAAVIHESAHVGRRDYALHVGLELIALPLFFHPVAMLLRRHIAAAREMACDEAAAAHCGARRYAEALVAIASCLSGPTLAVSMAASSIEQRVAMLLQQRHERRVPPLVVLAAVAGAAIACTRAAVLPGTAETLRGKWTLDSKASDLRAVRPRSYDEFTQSIAQGRNRIVVQQHRVVQGRVENVQWSVVTDGVQRPIEGIPHALGRAMFAGGTLTLAVAGPNAHRETVIASVRSDRLICDGATEVGRYHAEFARRR